MIRKPSSTRNSTDFFADPNSPIEVFFPPYEIHLIGGGAHSGRTSLLLRIATDYVRGLCVFGKPTHLMPCCWISLVHTGAQIRTGLAQEGDPPIPSFSRLDLGGMKNFRELYTFAKQQVPGVKVLFVDGLPRIGPTNENSNADVANFLEDTIRDIQKHKITIIGTGKYTKPRDNRNSNRTVEMFRGAGAWTELTSTYASIDWPVGAAEEDARRIAVISPKQSPPQTLYFCFDRNSSLIQTTAPTDTDADKLTQFDIVLLARPQGSIVTTTEINGIAEMSGGISRSALYRHLNLLTSIGKIEDAGYGKIKITQPN
jgi:hypothetical protein